MTELSIPLDREPRFVAPIGFEPAFEVRLDFEPVRSEQTPHGERRMRKIIGGSITGKIAGSVYPNGGGDYLLGRSDGATDLTRISSCGMTGANGSTSAISAMRGRTGTSVTSWVDADVRSDHNWVLGLFFVGVIEPLGEDLFSSAMPKFSEPGTPRPDRWASDAALQDLQRLEVGVEIERVVAAFAAQARYADAAERRGQIAHQEGVDPDRAPRTARPTRSARAASPV
jgi:hypothetical protein